MTRLVYASVLALMTGAGGAAAQDVTLTLWTESATAPESVFAQEFSAIDNGVTIEIREIRFDDLVTDTLRAVATGTNPDLIAIDNPDHAAFASRGAFLDITDQVAASDVIDIDAVFDGPRASLTWDGRIYGIPRASNTIALYYNRDLFAAAGLDPDSPPRTWDELLEAARALTDPENDVYGIAFSARASEEGTFQFLPWAQMAGGSFDNINAEGVADALALWKAFLDEGLASPDTLTRGQWDSTGTFNGGNAAMVISGPWELGRMASDAAFDWGVTLLPVREEGGVRASALGDFNLAIFANTDHPDEAFAFLEYYMSQVDRVWPEFTRLPSVAGVALAPTGDARIDAAAQVFTEQLSYARNRGPHPDWPRISQEIQTAFQSVLTGQAEAQEALDEAAERIDGIIN
ncbi:ABC transporter substrate-binding protein [Rhodophyticola porphyridii]|uniref:Sugar ABC transporter substrate-binding protein n=1 Tax=Rhodophyticola porphyridii TaxID=1852017 RepID=A0A3L9Y0I0_9RHOB|nr:sugar ABC transporter substrate-binding protein [Rhodophyticola porphyridii]RMA42324.1 sugar ABC transporter substrate-binding protein [Rhodophyticola porphyridii]